MATPVAFRAAPATTASTTTTSPKQSQPQNSIARYQRALAPTRCRQQEPTRDQQRTWCRIRPSRHLARSDKPEALSQERYHAFIRDKRPLIVQREYPPDIDRRRRLLLKALQRNQSPVYRLLAIVNWNGKFSSSLSLPCIDRSLGSVKTIEDVFPLSFPPEGLLARLRQINQGTTTPHTTASTHPAKEDGEDTPPTMGLEDLFNFGSYYGEHENRPG